MSAHRKPLEVILATGGDRINPGRFKGRAQFSESELGELGETPKTSPQRIKKIWAEFASEFPWLRRSDRAAIFALCLVRAKLEDEGEVDAKLLKQYLDGLKAIGGTPGERTRMPKGKDEEPEDDDADGDIYVR
jgi:hypothetical protein